jgi:pyridoxamine 5'-phosphate oxidase
MDDKASGKGLSESDAHADAVEQFRRWFADAQAAGINAPNGMTLSTVTAEGRPDGRVVLLKGFDARGFVFFTHETSRKAGSWPSGHRRAHLLVGPPRAASADRGRRRTGQRRRRRRVLSEPSARQSAGARLAASDVIPGRCRARESSPGSKRFTGMDVPRPPKWGGYRVVPAGEVLAGTAASLTTGFATVALGRRLAAQTRLTP